MIRYKRKDKSGFTLMEVIFVVGIMAAVVGAISSGWLFAYGVMASEGKRSSLRVDMLKVLETVRNDIRRSDVDYMSFYPRYSGEHTAISMPLPKVEDGLYVRDDGDAVVWESIVIYHVVESGGENILRRLLITPAEGISLNDLDDEVRYQYLQNVATGDDPDDPFTTQELITEGLECFSAEQVGSIVDFHDDSGTAIQKKNVIFGYVVLDPGEFTLRFTAKGEHAFGSGYRMGLDSIQIDPSGSSREVEYYLSDGSITTASGTGTTRIPDIVCGNCSYLQYDADGEDDYIEITDDYDLWRESSFDCVSLNNAMIDLEEVTDDVRVRLALPEDREEERIAWRARTQTGDLPRVEGEQVLDGRSGDLPEYPVVIRAIIKNECILEDADLVRIFVRAARDNPLKINAVYVTRKEVLAEMPNRLTDPDGLVNEDPSGNIDGYHMHQQLFFRDVYDGNGNGDTDEVLPEVWLPAGSEFSADSQDEDKGMWSEWVAFPMMKRSTLVYSSGEEEEQDRDYLVTFYVPDLESVDFPEDEPWTDFDPENDDCLYWQGGGTNSFIISGGSTSIAGTPDWMGQTVAVDDNIYFISGIDVWKKTGIVESRIFDTVVNSPDYTGIKWTRENTPPTGAGVTVKVRTSNYDSLYDADEWEDITGMTEISETPPSIGSGRYVQWQAELSIEPFWETDAEVFDYAGYIAVQRSGNDWEFPVDSSGDPYLAGVSSTWIDDVEVDWDGEKRTVAVKGDIARMNTYGWAEVTVNGRRLLKALRINIGMLKEVSGRTVNEENIIEVEPTRKRVVRSRSLH